MCFSGFEGNYSEEALRNADDIYGRSKALGELKDNLNLTLRSSIIGPEIKKNGEGLFDWFMKQKGEIKGYTNAYWNGITTLQLAKVISIGINENLAGLYHVTNGMKISKYDLLKIIKNIWCKDDVIILPCSDKIIDKTLQTSVRYKFEIPDFKTMLEEMYMWMRQNEKNYETYFKS